MRTTLSDIRTYGVSAVAFGALMSAGAGSASASGITAKEDDTTGLENLIDNITNPLDNAGNLLVGGAFVGGLALVFFGVVNLKKGAESDWKETTLFKCLTQLGIGALLIGFSSFGGSLTDSLGLGNATGSEAGVDGIKGF